MSNALPLIEISTLHARASFSSLNPDTVQPIDLDHTASLFYFLLVTHQQPLQHHARGACLPSGKAPACLCPLAPPVNKQSIGVDGLKMIRQLVKMISSDQHMPANKELFSQLSFKIHGKQLLAQPAGAKISCTGSPPLHCCNTRCGAVSPSAWRDGGTMHKGITVKMMIKSGLREASAKAHRILATFNPVWMRATLYHSSISM